MESYILSFPFGYVGSFLRALSLKGGALNVAAWVLYVLVALLPAGVYVWMKAKRLAVKLDLWLVFLSGYLFYAIYFMVNPASFSSVLPEMAGMMLNVGFYAFLFCYLVLRMLGWIRTGKRSALVKGLRLMLVILVVCFGIELIAGIVAIPQGVQALKAGNTAFQQVTDIVAGGPGMLAFSCLTLVLQKIVQMIPAACGLVISFFALKLLRAVAEDLYSDEAIERCKKLGLLCSRTLAIVVISQVLMNGFQILFHRSILSLNMTANLPVASVFYTIVVLLITSYMKENQELKQENDAFI